MRKKWAAIGILAAVLLGTACAVRAEASADAEEKVVYLTFDDGPSSYTAQLLDILGKYDAKASFFLVNTGVDMEKLLCRMAREGHAIGIHSYSHDFAAVYASEDAFMDDLYAMQALIFEKCGVRTRLLRFPGGSSNTVSRKYAQGIMSRLTQRVTGEGFVYFDWNVDSGDAYGCHDPERIYQNVIRGIRGKRRAVVLQHDVNGCSVQTVEKIILCGKDNGYVFRALGEDAPECHHRVQN